MQTPEYIFTQINQTSILKKGITPKQILVFRDKEGNRVVTTENTAFLQAFFDNDTHDGYFLNTFQLELIGKNIKLKDGTK